MIPILGHGPAIGWQDGLWLTGRAAIGPMLMLSALGKSGSRGSFDDALRQYRVLPERLVPAVGPAVIAIEAALGLALAAGYAVAWTLAAAASLLTVFAVAMTVNLLAGDRSPCGCGTSQNQDPISWRRVSSNLAASAAILCLLLAVKPAEPASVMATLVVLGAGFSAQLALHVWRMQKLVPRHLQKHIVRQAERYLRQHQDAEFVRQPAEIEILSAPAMTDSGHSDT